MDHQIKVGQVFKDNDPRMTRYVRIIEVHPNGASYRPCNPMGECRTHLTYTALAQRFYFDGKPRKSGFSLTLDLELGDPRAQYQPGSIGAF